MNPIVELQSGLARGVIQKHEDGFDYFAFKGIFYGEPPVGERRFKEPVAKKRWSGTVDCTNYGPACLQYDAYLKSSSYSEDCLHLNVFTHSINDENASNPVIVFVHGGAYMFGSSDDYLHGPEYLIRKNIVLVTVSYRVGVIGFLNLEDEVAPGNQGIKDVLLALQWVQQNVRVFGGNPDNVTGFGFSAGGILVHYLALSPLAKDLMHKVILQSSSIYSSWTRIKNPKSIAMKLCSILGKDLVGSKEILDFLRGIDAKQLLEAQENLRLHLTEIPFGPGPDGKSPTPVMPIDIEITAAQGLHLPCIMGYNSHEAIIIFKGMSRKEALALVDRDFTQALEFHTKDVLRRYDLSVEQVRRLYFKNETISERNAHKFHDFANDIYYFEGIHKLARVQAERSSAATYFYVFGYNPPVLLSKIMWHADLPGPSHLDDLPFLFKMRALESAGGTHLKKGTRSYRMMEQMTEMYTNFARHGKPTVDKNELIRVHWKPLNSGTVIRYLDVDEDITMRCMLNLDQRLPFARDIEA